MPQPQARTGATVEDLYKVKGNGRVAFAIAGSLLEYEEATGRGYAIADNVGFIGPRVFRRGEIADAEPVLPGWSMAVDAILKSSLRR